MLMLTKHRPAYIQPVDCGLREKKPTVYGSILMNIH